MINYNKQSFINFPLWIQGDDDVDDFIKHVSPVFIVKRFKNETPPYVVSIPEWYEFVGGEVSVELFTKFLVINSLYFLKLNC